MSVDDLSASLEDSLLDTSQSLNPEKKEHPRFSKYYKNACRKTEDQKKRRERLLEEQKQSRHDFHSLARSLVDASPEEEEGMNVCPQKSPKEGEDNPFRRGSRRGVKRPYKDLLMLSEWLLDVPMDFGDNWLSVPCPVGKRNLVVAGKGKTQFYSQSGSFLGSFPSHLPQGKRALDPGSSPWKKTSMTLLDCVYHQDSKVFYVLDVILWDGIAFSECDTELRSFWVRSKMQELQMSSRSKYNPHPFLPLPYVSCSELQTLVEKPLSDHFGGEGVALDGFLFYHREAFYHPGPTPLVGWLKGYMVPELMPEVKVHPDVLGDKPLGYSSMKTFIDDYNSDRTKRKIFTFQKDMPPPTELNESGEALRTIFAQKEVMSVEKAMEF